MRAATAAYFVQLILWLLFLKSLLERRDFSLPRLGFLSLLVITVASHHPMHEQMHDEAANDRQQCEEAVARESILSGLDEDRGRQGQHERATDGHHPTMTRLGSEPGQEGRLLLVVGVVIHGLHLLQAQRFRLLEN
jgi:hypothetical protein